MEGIGEPLCHLKQMWVFPKTVVLQNRWFVMENPIKMDDLGVPLFSETSKCMKKVVRRNGGNAADDSFSDEFSNVHLLLLDLLIDLSEAKIFARRNYLPTCWNIGFDAPSIQAKMKSNIPYTLRITGPCYRGVWMCIAGVWDLQTTTFEIP